MTIDRNAPAFRENPTDPGDLIAQSKFPKAGLDHPPAASGAGGAPGLINDIGNFVNVLGDNDKFRRDLNDSHGRIANALLNVPENTPGGVMVKFRYGYDGTGQMQYYGIDVKPGLNATQAYESASQSVAPIGQGTSATSSYIWIPKHPNTDFDPVSSQIPPNVSVMSLGQYTKEFRLSDAQTQNDRTALVEGNSPLNRQFSQALQGADAANAPNPRDSAALAVQTISQTPGYRPDADINLVQGKNGLIVSQGEGATALNLPVPQAKQGDFEKVSAQLAQAPQATALSANVPDIQQQNETQRQPNPVRV